MSANTEPIELQPMLPSTSGQQTSDNRIVEIEEDNSSCCSRYHLTSCVFTFFRHLSYRKCKLPSSTLLPKVKSYGKIALDIITVFALPSIDEITDLVSGVRHY